MLKPTLFILLGVLVLLSSSEETTVKPGLLVRVTKHSFDYVTNLAVNEAVARVRQTVIPNESGKVGFLKYMVYNMKITNFDIKSHSVVFVPNQGMKYKFADVNLVVSGKVYLKTFIIHMHSSFDVSASGISMGLNLQIGFDNTTGRATAVAGGCLSNVPPPHVTFHGRSHWILHFFSERLGKMIGKSIENQICATKTLNKINSKISTAMSRIPTTQSFLNDFTVDFRMLKFPDINTTFMDSQHKGEVFWMNNRKECPLPVRPMEPLPVSTTKSMVAVQVSAYLLNSFSYVAYKNHFFHYIFNSKNIPKAGLLNTTCQNVCIGKLIPELAKAYPNKEVSVLLEGSEMPEPNINKGYFLLDGTITLTIYLSTDSPSKPLIILPIKVHSISTANIENQVIHYNISVLKLKLGLVKKGLPIKIDVEQLQNTINFGINALLMPKINGAGRVGMPLPQVIKNLQMTNTQFQLGVNSAIFMTDFKFTPKFDPADESDHWFSSLLRSFGFPSYNMLSSLAGITTN